MSHDYVIMRQSEHTKTIEDCGIQRSWYHYESLDRCSEQKLHDQDNGVDLITLELVWHQLDMKCFDWKFSKAIMYKVQYINVFANMLNNHINYTRRIPNPTYTTLHKTHTWN